jgi:hypothetical protein
MKNRPKKSIHLNIFSSIIFVFINDKIGTPTLKHHMNFAKVENAWKIFSLTKGPPNTKGKKNLPISDETLANSIKQNIQQRG